MFGTEHLGLRAIAEALTAEGIPSPAAYDRRRNPHRDPTGWSHSAIRSILTNPTYLGTRSWGKQERVETLIDPDDPAAGNKSQMRWRPPSQWVTTPLRTHEPLITDSQAALVAARIAANTPGERRRPRVSSHPYCLRGLLYCAHCGGRMQGSWRPSRGTGPGRILYRCEVKRRRALPSDLADHPSTLYVREEAILQHLDPWIASFADPEWLASSQTADPVTAARHAGLRAQLGEVDRKIAHLMDAIESGGDAALLMGQLAKRNAEREALKVRIATAAGPSALKPSEVAALLRELGGMATVLANASPEGRSEIYAALGVQITYDDRTHQLRVVADLARVARRVGGGT